MMADSFVLKKGHDRNKDQSYFLFTLTQEQMRYVRFPLGGMTKEEVRGHAARLGLKVAEKAESQDICFVPDGDYVRFLEEQRGTGAMNGEIVHVDGQMLGRHLGHLPIYDRSTSWLGHLLAATALCGRHRCG